MLYPLFSGLHDPNGMKERKVLSYRMLQLFIFFNFLFIFLAASGLSCGTQDLRYGTWASL